MLETIKKILAKENIKYNSIEKSTSGFTNEVYFIDDKYVVKIVAKRSKPEKLKKEIEFYKNVKFDFIPSYICSGNLDEINYLIITKLRGKSLYSVWHILTDEQRNKCSKQIANILKIFNQQKGDFLPEKYIHIDNKKRFQKSFNLNIEILEKRGFDVGFLKDFANTKLDVIMNKQKLGLVYNDAHFDNFILDEEKLYLIDFDRVLYCSIDYELLIIEQMLDNPCKFASEVDEPNVKLDDYKNIHQILKQNYKDLFDFEFIDDRVFIYRFLYNLGNAYEYDKNEWIKIELDKFKNRYKKTKD